MAARKQQENGRREGEKEREREGYTLPAQISVTCFFLSDPNT